MAFDFPSSPALDEVFIPAGGSAYVFKGYGWKLQGDDPTGMPEAPIDNQTYSRTNGDWVANGQWSNTDFFINTAFGTGSDKQFYFSQAGELFLTDAAIAYPTQATTKQYVDDAVAAGGGGGGSAAWDDITGKPSTFPPTLPIAQSGITNLVTDLSAKAPLASPVFTGDPTAPTPTAGDNTTNIATTAFVTSADQARVYWYTDSNDYRSLQVQSSNGTALLSINSEFSTIRSNYFRIIPGGGDIGETQTNLSLFDTAINERFIISTTMNVPGDTLTNLLGFDETGAIVHNVQLKKDIFDFNSMKLRNVVDPTSAQDAATKKYVDDTLATSGYAPLASPIFTGDATFADIVLPANSAGPSDTSLRFHPSTQTGLYGNSAHVSIAIGGLQRFQISTNQTLIAAGGANRLTIDTTAVTVDASVSLTVGYKTRLQSSAEMLAINDDLPPLQIGSTAAINTTFDKYQIQTRNNGVASKLWINYYGGDVGIGYGGGVVQIGGNSVASPGLSIFSTQAADLLRLYSYSSATGSGPNIEFYRRKSTQAANDYGGGMRWYGYTATTTVDTEYANIMLQFVDTTSGSTNASMIFSTVVDGTLAQRFRIASNGNLVTAGAVDVASSLTAASLISESLGTFGPTTSVLANPATGIVLGDTGYIYTKRTGTAAIGHVWLINNASVTPTTVGQLGTSAADVVLSNDSTGNILLRPSGIASTTGQASLTPAGALTLASTITAAVNFNSSTTSAILASSGAGTVGLYPNGSASTTGALRVTTTGLGVFGATPAARAALALPTGTISRVTYVTSSVTLPILAGVVMAIITDLRAMGFFT